MALTECGAASTDSRGRELAGHGSALFPAAFYLDNISRGPVPWHWHDEPEVLVVEAGTACVSVNGADCLLSRGDGLFINAGVLHAFRTGGEETCFLRAVVFHPRLVGGGVDSVVWQKYVEPLISDPCRPFVPLPRAGGWEAEAAAAVGEAWQAGVYETEGFELEVRERLSKVVFLLWKNCPAEEKRPSEKVLRDGGRVKLMLQYINGHLGGELSLAEIAASAAVSENECLRCFRSMIGCTPIQYLRQARVQKAAELLLSTERKISDIAAECGFLEMSYFSRTFRELKGCTPSRFRRCGQDPAGS